MMPSALAAPFRTPFVQAHLSEAARLTHRLENQGRKLPACYVRRSVVQSGYERRHRLNVPDGLEGPGCIEPDVVVRIDKSRNQGLHDLWPAEAGESFTGL